MSSWLILFAILYIAALVLSAIKSKKSIKKNKDYFLPQIGAFLGFLTFSATLFSTFTLMGMPDFFRVHGVGAWIFLGVTDTALAFILLWFGVAIRSRYSKDNFLNISSIIKEKYNSKIAQRIYQLGIFIFLIPYVAIQIKGISEFISYTQVFNIPAYLWASIFLVIILIYSYLGGMKAIIISDAIQGLMLLLITIFIAFTCVKNIGGISELFMKIQLTNPELLSIPGPKNLLTVQFLLSSFIVIILMPISQPQLLTRIVIMKSLGDIKRMAIAFSVFAFIIIIPTIFIGLSGAVNFTNASVQEFLYGTLVEQQFPAIGALAIIGLIAAAMSTSDSQLFAIQTEIIGSEHSGFKNKILIVVFGIIALLLSIFSTQQLVLLARISFAGMALMTPMIFVALFSKTKQKNIVPIVTFATLIIYLIANFTEMLPFSDIYHIRIDMLLLSINTLTAFATYIFSLKQKH